MNLAESPIDYQLNEDFDLILNANGEFAYTYGLDTSILVSVYTNAYTYNNGSNQSKSLQLLGYWGNLFLTSTAQYGCLATQYLSRMSSENITFANNAILQSLQWLIDNKLAKSIKLSTTYDTKHTNTTVSILPKLDSNLFNDFLWKNTQKNFDITLNNGGI